MYVMGGQKFLDWGGGLPIWVGGTFAGEGQYPITCHGNFNFYLSFSNALHQKH